MITFTNQRKKETCYGWPY